jgi:hypothetical protein
MTNPTKLANRRLAKAAVAHRGCHGWRGALSSFALLALTGCGLSTDGAGALFVDPGRYTLYHCDDLAARRKMLIARENELRGLIERAGESTGGAVIGLVRLSQRLRCRARRGKTPAAQCGREKLQLLVSTAKRSDHPLTGYRGGRLPRLTAL